MKDNRTKTEKEKMLDFIETITEAEFDLISLYSTGEIAEWLEKDEEYVAISLAAVMMERSHFSSLGMVIGEA